MTNWNKTLTRTLLVFAVMASMLTVAASPASAEPVFTATPTTDLVDGQTISITATGFLPNAPFGGAVCNATVIDGAQNSTGCDLSNTFFGQTDANGDFSASYTVFRYINVGDELVDCASASGCIIGAASLGDSLIDATDTVNRGFVVLNFDPNVPAQPPLTIDVEVNSVTRDAVAGTVTCSRTTTASINGTIEQERSGAEGSGWLQSACSPDGVAFSVEFTGPSARFRGGDAQWTLWASASDGRTYASDLATGTSRVTGGSLPLPAPANQPGDNLTIGSITSTAKNGSPVLVVEVTCLIPVQIELSASARQHKINGEFGSGYASLDCDGTVEVELPLDGNGLSGGLALATVTAYSYSVENDVYTFDQASATTPVKLQGALPRIRYEAPAPNPDSRITIDSVSSSMVTVTVYCDEPAYLDLSATLTRARGPRLTQVSGYEYSPNCDGPTTFAIELYDSPARGKNDVVVSGYAYRFGTVVIDGQTYETYENVWDDYQSTQIRIR